MRLPSWRPGTLRGRRPAGRVILHIGRNKSGSTTIQEYCLDNRAALLREGIRFVMFGHVADNIPGVEGFPHVPELAEYARRHKDETILVSYEFLSGWSTEYVQSMARDLAGLDVSVLVYIRPYPQWVLSSYAFDVHCGWISQDFDTYFETLTPRISAWPILHRYGECFGIKNVRVRALDERLARGTGLLGDFRTALGLQPDAAGSPFANASRHWAVIEMLRAVSPGVRVVGWPEPMLAAVRGLTPKLNACVSAHAACLPEPAYLTADQAGYLDKLYAGDMAQIMASFGMPAPVASPYRIRQGPCPSWALLPASFLRDAAQIAAGDQVTVPLSAALAALAAERGRAS